MPPAFDAPSAPRLAGLLMLAMLLVVPACTFETVEEEDLTESIESLLLRASGAWNEGDVEGFLDTFADASSTTVILADGPVLDRQAFVDGAASILADGTSAGALRFEEVAVRPLPPLIGIVTGRFRLSYSAEDERTGSFTAVVRRLGGGWKIVHAHAS